MTEDSPLDPHKSPHEMSADDAVEIFRNLPVSTRKWLQGKKPEDFANLDAMIKAVEMGKWNAKLIGVVAGLFVGTVGLIVSIKTVISWIRPL